MILRLTPIQRLLLMQQEVMTSANENGTGDFQLSGASDIAYQVEVAGIGLTQGQAKVINNSQMGTFQDCAGGTDPTNITLTVPAVNIQAAEADAYSDVLTLSVQPM
jgi:hypothetical protein